LEDFISCIEKSLDKKAHKKMLPIQPGDVPKTWADISDLKGMGYKSSAPIEKGVEKFVKWYKEYYKL
jgi:UDP-glucuronate 4-epimerase